MRPDASQRERADAAWRKFSQGPRVTLGSDAVARALDLFVFALHLAESITESRIGPQHFVQELNVSTNGDEGFKIHKIYTADELQQIARNLIFTAMGDAAISADVVLKEAFGGHKPFDTSEFESARNVIYMVRCAFAHGPFAPKWKAEGQYRRVYRVPSIGLGLNVQALNGAGLNSEHVGGWLTFVRMMQLAITALQEHERTGARPTV